MISLPPATYDPEMRRIVGPKGAASATRSEHALLLKFAERRGKLVTHDALIGALWEPDREPETAPHAMRVHLCRLQKKLAAVGADGLIQNVWGAGYLLAEQQPISS